jgi:hypothetical protein
MNTKAMYAATIFYAPMTLSIKLSLLSLIARVFAPYKTKVQGIYALGIILIIYYITSWILKIRIRAPISACQLSSHNFGTSKPAYATVPQEAVE